MRLAGITSGPLLCVQQSLERLGEFGFEPDADVVVVVGQDEDLLVERLVEEASDVVGCAEVGGVAVGCEVEGHLEVGLDGVPLGVGCFEFAGDVGEGFADAVLFLAEEVEGDRFGVVGFHETIANFHGLFARIFRAHASVIGLSPQLIIPDFDWVGEQCRSRGLGFNLAGQVQDLLREIKQEPLDDGAVDQRLVDAGLPDALDIERQRVSEGRLTYDDLPRLAELILADDGVANLYRHHFDAVIVDEFQDLTPQQLRIVNRIGYGKTTYAGDLAQGIYGFMGARPDEVDAQVRAECRRVIEFAESHRSSPAVLAMVNTLAPLTGGTTLKPANPESWPGGGLAVQVPFDTTEAEADWAVNFARFVLRAAPSHRIGLIARTGPRRRFVDVAVEASELQSSRWDDGVLDTDTARMLKALLSRLNVGEFRAAIDPVAYLRTTAGLEGIQDPSTREALGSALNWCCDLLQQDLDAGAIKSRIRVGDESTLLSVPGVHLLTGHMGKGQQFDWVLVVGAEDGCVPDFRAESQSALQEEARILSVALSRARHGAVMTHARKVAAASTGAVWSKQPSRFWSTVSPACRDSDDAIAWLKAARWQEVADR